MWQRTVRLIGVPFCQALGERCGEGIERIELFLLAIYGLIQYIEQVVLMREFAFKRDQSLF